MNLSRRSILVSSFAATVAPFAFASGTSTEREMRRKDRQLTEEECFYLIRHTPHAVLSTTDNSGTPYGVPVTPILLNGKLYFHCSKAGGRKVDNLRQNERVSLCFIGKDDINQKEFAVDFASVVVAGTAKEITDPQELRKIQLEICKIHAPEAGAKAAEAYFDKGGKGIAVWEVTPTKISGKSRNKHLYFGKNKGQCMPIVTIKITGDEESPGAESKKQLISKITNVIGEVLHKNTHNLCVIIEAVPMDSYGIGGVTVRELRRRK